MSRPNVIPFVLLSGLLAATPSAVFAQAPREIPFESTADFLVLPPGRNFGEGAGIAVNSKGHVYVYTRDGDPGHILAPRGARLLEFGPDGRLIREISDLYSMAWAHAVRVDKDDNVWLVDNGSDTIVRLNPEGRVTLVLGRRRESKFGLHPFAQAWDAPTPPARDTIFNEPTDVAWDPQGNIFISDGYRNMSVAKLDRNGAWVKRIGRGNMAELGSGPGEFNNPHGIAADAQGKIYVADRGNRRIQVFDSDLRFLREITIDVPVPPDATVTNFTLGTALPGGAKHFEPGAPWALCITPGPGPQALYVADAYPGRVYKLTLDGTVLGYLGKNGKQVGEFNWIHAIACPREDEIYVAEILTWRQQKITLKPGPGQRLSGR